ncbi:flagellar assembly protein T N-terminal domain-containing protein [Lacimonas salitolerans]|uniref:Flagellar assembly protein T N-terminal domain-containing protein n=1 Tax=Lacimonas salitolerans TaxID=1323750 RepID=A0ABW4EJ64_9RHOB
MRRLHSPPTHRRAVLWVILACLVALTTAPVAATAEMVRVTGRAVLAPNDIPGSRRRALEDALYLAAMKGGADVDAFSAVDMGVLTADSILLRASTRIVDFAVVDEFRGQSQYEVTIDAYVGEQPQLGCAARPDLALTVGVPKLRTTQQVPHWIDEALKMAHDETVNVLRGAANVRLADSTISLAPKAEVASRVADGFDYQSLLTGKAPRQGGGTLPREARGLHLSWSAQSASARAERVVVTLEARIVDPAAPSRTRNLKLQKTVTLTPDTPWRALNVLASKDWDSTAKDLSRSFGKSLATWLEQSACAPLVANLAAAGKGRYRVDLGTRDGLTRQSLAFVDGGQSAWTVLRVVELGASSAIVAPMNLDRAPSGLAGTQVHFNDRR